MTVVFQEQFTGANGAAWDASRWATSVNNTGVVDIQSNAGRMMPSGAAFAHARALTTMTAIGDQEIVVTFTLADLGEAYPMIHLRHGGSWNGASPEPLNGYTIELQPAGNTWSLDKRVAGTKTGLGSVGRGWTTGAFRLRFRCQGTTISARIWPSANPEPATWDISVTDASLASGVAGLSAYNGNATTARTITFDDLGVDDLTSAGTNHVVALAFAGTGAGNVAGRLTLGSRAFVDGASSAGISGRQTLVGGLSLDGAGQVLVFPLAVGPGAHVTGWLVTSPALSWVILSSPLSLASLATPLSMEVSQ